MSYFLMSMMKQQILYSESEASEYKAMLISRDIHLPL
jgi:hypothetical protein